MSELLVIYGEHKYLVYPEWADTREVIYVGLEERIPHLKRRECTPRVMGESGVDMLLDRLIEIQDAEYPQTTQP